VGAAECNEGLGRDENFPRLLKADRDIAEHLSPEEIDARLRLSITCAMSIGYLPEFRAK
jgi:hypothetical protein